ncbi:protein involved in gliding motility GldM [Polaribacter sp. KT25b]|uniref:type IX secretion system motor protein PorM/GldM n=1 Tax=Polaribacter sp. KT25b TaxID=1855336 RepID=UPI00087C94D4|nr:gliding motility protein GldM [Polaribacter sp. KT25b]SDR67717.1 protein involved in gliding motility GldM [Polaribacter sp. KT25b]
MAGGKMSARQKMINLMYLVFIAMLAMQMSREVLSAFGFMNEKLETNNISTIEKNKQAYANLATKASEQTEKFGKLNTQAKKIKQYSADFYSYLGELKTQMTTDLEDKKAYESMDKTTFLDTYFFKGDNYTPKGQEFLDNINAYRTNVNATLGEGSKFEALINSRFDTNDVIDSDGKTVPWLKYRYEGFPLIASLTNLTQMQADIKNSESEILNSLLGGKLEESLSLNNYKGIVALDKNAYFAGEKVTGKIVLGRYDAEMVPDNVILNGKDYKKIESGQVIIDMPAGNIGNHDIKGKIAFTQNGKVVEVPFESSYSVIPEPSNAVVSADKMNVVYRGLNNPISVSLPGVSDNNLSVSASGGNLTGSNGKYSIKPGSGKIATINVSAKLSSGKTVNSKATFRIKDIPAAMGSVREQYGTVRMPKSGLANSPISAGLPDFEFDLNITVKSFKIKVPGELTIIVNGTTLSAAAKKVLNKAQRGDIINIYDIKATANGYNLKQVLPVNIELTN